jgi:serine phosphatase RsbU (regulator of sigma subunit)
MVSALGLLLAAFVADWHTGSEVASSLFYVIAIMFGAWFVGRGAGLVLAMLSVVGWLVAYYLVGAPFSKPSVLGWNLFGEISVYVITALAVAQAKAGLERAHALAERLQQANLALDRETLAVGDLQREMLPEAPPEIHGYHWETLYLTSTRAGGDYYDFFPLSGGRIGILVADASGHGAPAAVLMAMTRVLLHTASEAPEPPDRALSRLNGQLVGTLPQGWFVTACYAVLDPASGRLEYSLAGHDPPLVVRAADGPAERLASHGGLPLGLSPHAAYESGSTMLGRGDTLVLHTDGVTEAMSPTQELFGDERLLHALKESRALALREMRRHLLAQIHAHRAGAPLSDDLTLLLLRRLEAAAGDVT